MKAIDFKDCDVIIGIDYIMEVTLIRLFLLNPKYYQYEIWSNTSVLYEKHFYHVFASMLGTGNKFQTLL